ncbi:MAG: alpha-L-fucosidase, partial [Bacteroidota bacterium]|nr:alpha-L-fucosidase [Bacteroidota bacterium]
MKKSFLLFVLAVGLSQFSWSQKAVSQKERMKWWSEARFGMFIHWGVYSVPGGVYKGHEMRHGGAEWIMNR